MGLNLCFRQMKRMIRLSSKLLMHRNYRGYRFASSIAASKLEFREFGDPAKVLRLVNFELPREVTGSKVLLKVLAAPVHPADINTIQGVYGIKPTLPAVPGHEGVAEVLMIGSDVKNLQPGDRVVPIRRSFSTWRTHHVCDEFDLDKVPNTVPLIIGATILVNPVTAYRMMHDFVNLKPGDTIIQNSANSAVGQAVIQLARHFGFKTINVVRKRPEADKLELALRDMGADIVVLDEELRTDKMKKIFNELPRPRLALNGTCGPVAVDMTRWLADGSKMVTYGAMSRQPLTASATSLIFRDISFHGFWCNRFTIDPNNASERRATMDILYGLASDGVLRPPAHTRIPFSQFAEALTKAAAPFIGEKQMLIMDTDAK